MSHRPLPPSEGFSLRKAPATSNLLVLALGIGLVAKLVSIANAVQCCGDWPHDRVLISSTLAASLFLMIPVLLFSGRRRVVGAVAINVLLMSIAVADLIHFRFYNDVISIAELGDAWQVLTVLGSVWTALRWQDALYFADVVVVIALGLAFRRRADLRSIGSWRQVFAAALAAFALAKKVAKPLSAVVVDLLACRARHRAPAPVPGFLRRLVWCQGERDVHSLAWISTENQVPNVACIDAVRIKASPDADRVLAGLVR